MEDPAALGRIVKARLDDGTTIAVEVVGGGESDVARLGPVSFAEMTTQLRSLARTLMAPFTELEPSRAAVEFGCCLGVESGRLFALLVKGTANANLKVTLEWTNPT